MADVDSSPPLSLREQELVELLLTGNGYDAIGLVLGISVNTIKRHVLTISKKMGLNGRYGIAARVYRERLLEAESQRNAALDRLESARTMPPITLTPRERDIVEYLINGLSPIRLPLFLTCHISVSSAIFPISPPQWAQLTLSDLTIYVYKNRLRWTEAQRDVATETIERLQFRSSPLISQREEEVVEHLFNGSGYDVIGGILDTSPETIKRHISASLRRLEVT